MKSIADSRVAAFVLAAVLLVFLPVSAAASDAVEPVAVMVSILPQAWFADRVGGEYVEVSVLVGPGQSPSTFDPSPKQLAALGEAELFLYAGVPFERGLLPRIDRLPQRPLLAGVGAATETVGHQEHRHGHDHGELDPHTWLDPLQAQTLADTLCAALCRLRPAAADGFRTRREALRTELDSLDREIAAILAAHRGREIYVFHPAFGHFTARYGLVQVAIEEGGREPGARHLAEVIERAKAAGAGAIIVQPQFSRKSARTVARSLGVEVVALDPLAADYAANLIAMARELDRILGGALPDAGGSGS